MSRNPDCDTCKIKEQHDNLEKGLRMAIRFVLNMKELIKKSVGEDIERTS